MENFKLEQEENQVLIKTDIKSYDRWERFANRANVLLERFASHYGTFAKKIGVDPSLTTDILKQLLNQSEYYAESLIEKAVLKKEEPLHQFYRESYWILYNEAEKNFDELRRHLSANSMEHETFSSLPEIVDGQFNITETFLKDFKKENFETWSDANNEIFKALTNIKESYELIKKIGLEKGVLNGVPKVGAYAGLTLLTPIDFFLSVVNDEIVINTDSLNRLR